jgi:hypothetical protein
MSNNLLKNAIANLKEDQTTKNDIIKSCLSILEQDRIDYDHFQNEIVNAFNFHFPAIESKYSFTYIKVEWPQLFSKLLRSGNDIISIKGASDSMNGTFNMVLWQLFGCTNFGFLLSLYLYDEMLSEGLISHAESPRYFLESIDCCLLPL